MFERTFSLWRRLVGSRPNKPTPDNPTEDRRVWVRFPADLETTYGPADGGDRGRFSAIVRDISVGGLSLIADRSFAPGDMLTVELPGPRDEASYSVLACVVHVTAQSDCRWALGCTFSRELSDDDLAPFGARRSQPGEADQRNWDRYPCEVQASYQDPTEPEAGRQPAKVLNISPSGVRLLVGQAVQNGSLLSIALHSPTGEAGKNMLSCVVHVTRQGDTGEWALGCNFISELSEAELLALL